MFSAQQTWKGFHWSFFMNVQGLLMCLRRFEEAIALNNIPAAQVELDTATTLMLAAGASMELAGSFSAQEYEAIVRPSMTPPHVESDNFSGLMSWEHAVLVQLWKRLSPTFAALPSALHPHHSRFVTAYGKLARAHKAVCKKFGGDEGGSIRFERSTATDTLEKFGRVRTQTLDPNHRADQRFDVP
ncbi:MAG: siderophore biosynthesis protein [Cyanothece sp. SIO2G6]|nr:siderophore biosynthesis protein [Cyanothece sp. SIO2G6]